MEQLVIVLIIGAVSLIKWLMEKSTEARTRSVTDERSGRPIAGEAPSRSAPTPVYRSFGAEEASRRLREALGLPEETELPVPRPQKKPVILSERPMPEFFPPVPFENIEPRFAEPLPLEERPAPVPKRAALLAPVQKPPPARSGLNELLRSREGLRRAILAQEILGTPKGLVF